MEALYQLSYSPVRVADLTSVHPGSDNREPRGRCQAAERRYPAWSAATTGSQVSGDERYGA